MMSQFVMSGWRWEGGGNISVDIFVCCLMRRGGKRGKKQRIIRYEGEGSYYRGRIILNVRDIIVSVAILYIGLSICLSALELIWALVQNRS